MGSRPLSSLFARALFRLRLAAGTVPSEVRRLGWRLMGARIGRGTNVPRLRVTWPHQLAIGRDCILEEQIYFKFDGIWRPGPSIVIGDGTFIGRFCEFNIRSGLRVGARSLIASGCTFIDHDHDIPLVGERLGGGGIEAPIVVAENVWIGANVTVLKGVVIGRGAIVGAGAVVNRCIPDYEIWAGVPARKIGQRIRTPQDRAVDLSSPASLPVQRVITPIFRSAVQ